MKYLKLALKDFRGALFTKDNIEGVAICLILLAVVVDLFCVIFFVASLVKGDHMITLWSVVISLCFTTLAFAAYGFNEIEVEGRGDEV